MKRKKAAVVPVAEMEQPVSTPAGIREGSPLDTVWVCLFSVLLFVSMTIQTGRMALILAALALVLSIGKGPLRRLRERLSLPVLGLVAFAVMNGLAAVYSSFGGYAVSEFYKIFASVSLAVILLARFDKRHVRGLLWGIGAVCAVISLICIDMGSWGKLFEVFNSAANVLGSDYSSSLQNSEGLRVNGIYNDANITGGILGLACLAALYLVHTEQTRWKKAVASVFLGMSAVGLLISMSRGAMLCFCIAALVYLAAEQKDRLSLFFLMVMAAVSVAVTGALAMVRMEAGSILPDILAVLCGLLIFLLDWGIGARLARQLKGHGLAVLAVCVGLLVLAGVGGAAALRMTEPYIFEEGDPFLYRSLSLKVGEYTISADGSDVGLLVYSRTEDEALMNRETTLYNGPLSEATFTVPEAAVRVYFQFTGKEGDTLYTVGLSNGQEIPLKYRLLPEMIASRLQEGFFTGHSYLQRVQYLKDGWVLFQQSPLLGHGLGSTEGLYTAVQPYYYESLYAHNHILQVMCDMGLLGLAAFLALLLGVAWLLLKNLRSDTGSLAAMLLACWVMMNAHGAMEIDFSIRAFQCVALPLLLLPVVLYAKPLSEKAVKWGGLVLSGCIWLFLAVFGGLLESHRMVEREIQEFSTTDVREFMETLESYVRRDVFDHEQNQLTYVGNAALLNDSAYNGNMRRYAEELRASGTYTACSGLARYYYLPRGEFEELFACSRKGIAQEASVADAWNLQLEFYRNGVLPAAGAENMAAVADGVLALRDWLGTYSEGRLEEIVLTEENRAFLDAVASAREAGVPEDGMYFYLTQIMGFGQTAESTEG